MQVETLQLSQTVSKIFGSLRASVAGDKDASAPKPQPEEYVPLAANEESVPLEGGDGDEEMGRTFDDQFEKAEGRSGDAVAQIVAIVSIV